MRKHLIHIGYGKAGSTFLQKWFKEHPQLRYEGLGIGGFKNVFQIIEWSTNNIENSPRYYVTSHETFGAGWINLNGSLAITIKSGKFTTRKRMAETQTKVCRSLFEIFPNSKILIITRGFKSALLSSYSEYVKEGGDLSLSGYLNVLEPLNLQWLDIDFLYTLYAETFGEDNIILLPFELLKESQNDFIHLLEGKLEIDHLEIDFGVQNPSLTQVEINWYRGISRIILLPLNKILPLKILGFIYNKYSSSILRPNKLKKPIHWLDKLLKPKHEGFELPDEYIDKLKNKANCLQRFPLYEKYLSEYLINSYDI